jgi:DNA transformation protein and related proteins
MDARAIQDIFEPVGKVTLRRMFGGHGIYAHGIIFALEINGEIWLKADDINRPALESQGSKPFTYEKKTGKVAAMSYWLMPEECHEDADALIIAARAALDAAVRAQSKKSAPRRPAKKAT